MVTVSSAILTSTWREPKGTTSDHSLAKWAQASRWAGFHVMSCVALSSDGQLLCMNLGCVATCVATCKYDPKRSQKFVVDRPSLA
jgi:hypothetical protein